MTGHEPNTGHRPRSEDDTRALLDTFLPRYDFRERHSRVIAAPRQVVWDAIKDVTLAEMPVAGLLFALRSLPARLTGKSGLPRAGDRPVIAQLPDSGFATLAEAPGQELVVGLIAQMWKLRGETVRIRNGADFLAFERTGFVKAAMNFHLSDSANGTRLATETRVLATDTAARTGFGRYWLVIRPFSGLIRRLWLWAIARRATRHAPV
jgi:Protein of unknown function (DUF2867)